MPYTGLPHTYDAVVLGLGAMGSATAYYLARRGLRVLGLEQFSLGHHRGSSHGRTRVIRTAYYEHPAYVPLLHRCFEGWYDLEQRVGQPLVTECGCLSIGPAEGALLAGIRQSAAQHELAISELSAADLATLGMPFRLAEGDAAIYEEQAGFLAVEACVRAFQQSAQAFGATLMPECPVLSWQLTGNAITIETRQGSFAAAKLIVTAGAWATQLLADMGVRLTVMRQVQNWFRPTDPALFRRDRCPVFLHDSAVGIFYGIPMIGPEGVKVAQHYGAPEHDHPEAIDWSPHEADLVPVRAYLNAHLPGLNECTAQEVCLYTLSPDRHFIIDAHPTQPNVLFAAGFSGHGFKFAPVVGESLAAMACGEPSLFPADVFGLARFQAANKQNKCGTTSLG